MEYMTPAVFGADPQLISREGEVHARDALEFDIALAPEGKDALAVLQVIFMHGHACERAAKDNGLEQFRFRHGAHPFGDYELVRVKSL